MGGSLQLVWLIHWTEGVSGYEVWVWVCAWWVWVCVIFKHVEFMSVIIWGGSPMRGEKFENFYLLLALSLPVLP